MLWLGWRVAGPPAAPEGPRAREIPRTANDDAAETSAAVARGEVDEPSRETAARTGVDASNHYKNAFVLFDRLTEEEKKMIRQPREEVDAEEAAQLFEKIRAILDLLHEAAGADYCDWGQGPITFETPLPQLAKAQNLGRLSLWAAAYQFSTDPAAALATLGDRAQLGHHLADTLIGLLVQTSFERGANELLLQNAGALDGTLAASALDLLRGSKLDANVARAFETERAGVAEMGPRLAKSPAELAAMIDGPNAGTQPPTVEALMQFASDPARLAAEIEFILEMEKTTAVALTLPEAEYQAWRKEAEARLGDDHPLAKMTLPALIAVQPRLQQTRVERTLLSAGLDIRQNGLARLAGYRDPATGRALTYVPTPAGFDLRSTYAVKGRPVAMSFATGQPAAR